MNINANELLLLNKKVKFGETPATPANVTIPAPETEKPQTGLNVLAFEGLKNLTSNPQLSAKIAVEQPLPEQEGKAANAPYKNSIAFQGGKFKNLSLAAMMALITLGAASLTSCSEDDPLKEYDGKTEINITNNVTINYSQDEAKWQAMYDLLLEYMEMQGSQNQDLQDQMTSLLTFMQSIMLQMQQDGANAAEFYKKMFDFIAQNLANQNIIITLLTQNGMSQDEANMLLHDLIDKVESGQLSAAEAMKQLLELVTGIKDLLQQAINNFNKYYEEMLAKQDELIETNKQGFAELIAQGDITNETLQNMTAQNDSLIVLNNKQIEAQEDIKEAIEKANLDSNANFATVVATLNMNKDEIIKALMKMGYTQIQVEKMTAGQIIEAIEKNTKATEISNNMLSGITNFVSLLPGIYQNGMITNAQLGTTNYLLGKVMNFVKVLPEMYANDKITQTQIEEFYKLYQEAIKQDGTFNEATLSKLEELVSKLESIQGTLDTISEQLTTLINDLKAMRDQYTDDKAKEFELLSQLVVDNKIQTAQLGLMQATQKDMAESLKGIKENTDELLVIAKDDTKHKELLEAIKKIQAGGTTSIDYQKLEDMFKLLGMTITDALNMSSAQLQAKIEEFQNTYIATEQKQLEEIQTVNAKLDDLKIFSGLSKDEIVMAIDKVTSAVNSGNANLYEELKALEAQLDKLQAAVDAMYKAIGEASEIANNNWKQFNSKFDSALGLLENIDTDLSKIMSNQTIANMYLETLNKSLGDLKVEIQKIQVAIEGNGGSGSGSSITLDQLEELWKQHDEANYNRYKELLQNLKVDVDVDTTTIEGLLKSIDEKLNGLNDNSEILDEILKLLKGIDWTSPDYTSKLNEIIEILKNFKCNCDCGSSNEGILGELEDVLS